MNYSDILIFGLTIRELIATILLLIGFFFIAISAIGVIRLPDFYSRLHSSGIGETLGLMISFLGLAVFEGFNLMTIKLLIVFLLVFLANPIGTHILGQAAIKSGLVPWEIEEKEEADKNAESHH